MIKVQENIIQISKVSQKDLVVVESEKNLTYGPGSYEQLAGLGHELTYGPGSYKQLAGLGHELVHDILTLVPQRDGDVDNAAHVTERHQRAVQEQREQVTLLTDV